MFKCILVLVIVVSYVVSFGNEEIWIWVFELIVNWLGYFPCSWVLEELIVHWLGYLSVWGVDCELIGLFPLQAMVITRTDRTQPIWRSSTYRGGVLSPPWRSPRGTTESHGPGPGPHYRGKGGVISNAACTTYMLWLKCPLFSKFENINTVLMLWK